MPLAARVTDLHTCPLHIGGPILPPGVPTILIGSLPAAHVSTLAMCIGPVDTIVRGSPTVLLAGRGAARVNDNTMHGGRVSNGHPHVDIGDFGPGGVMAFLQSIVDGVNPLGGTINCGQIIDAVAARLTGLDADATAVTAQDGSWAEIEARHNTQIAWGQTFGDAFTQMQAQPDGTNAIIGIKYKNPDGTYASSSHVVVMTKQDGQVAILEGQSGGSVVTSAADAETAYGSTSEVGVGVRGSHP